MASEECIGRAQRHADAMQRNRVIAPDRRQRCGGGTAVDEIIFAMHLEPRESWPFGTYSRYMGSTQPDARIGRQGRGWISGHR